MQLSDLKDQHPEHWKLATAIRALSMDAVQAARSGHPGMPMGMADVATVLFRRHLKFCAGAPAWPDRDRFILSAGHGSMLLYSLLHLTGYEQFGLDQLKAFRQLGSLTAGHPEFEPASGVETTTGPLGQGFANAVGFAIAEESMRSRFGNGLVDHRTYVLVGDGCLMEGISQEAAGLAGRLQLSRLIALWDDNGITIDGKVGLSDATDQAARFAAAGWTVLECDGHDPSAIDEAISEAKGSSAPALIACKTRIGFGSPNKEGSAAAHGSPLGPEEVELTRSAYGWPHAPFELPQEVRQEWLETGKRCNAEHHAWEERVEQLSERKRAQFHAAVNGQIPTARLSAALKVLKSKAASEGAASATRKASELVLSTVNSVVPTTIGGSADLTGSNNTLTPDLGIFDRTSRNGRYIHFGIREHAMAAAMNGMALHGGVRPYGGTFLCFADYARPAMRLSALMGVPVVYVMTHDSIGLGEDGPTHQPIEHLAMLRATPNLNVIRPCDTIETAEAWQIALEATATPTVIALSRQGVPAMRKEVSRRNLTARGAYVLREATSRRQVILMATGTELSVAAAARDMLEEQGIGTRLVSMPCWELFEQQEERYRRRVLPRGSVRVAVEAGARLGWERWLCGEQGSARKSGFVGMNGFGASAPAGDLFRHFGITPEAVVEKVKSLL